MGAYNLAGLGLLDFVMHTSCIVHLVVLLCCWEAGALKIWLGNVSSSRDSL